MTSEVDITILSSKLKERGFKFYPAFIYMVTKVVNSNESFRICFNSKGDLGYWEEMSPSYTIFDSASTTFSSIWTETSNSFAQFHDRYLTDVQKYNGTGKLFPKMPIPEYTFPISMLPWSSFTAFNLNINNVGDYLLPIITGGKYVEKEKAKILPVSVQLHHAVCDGYHASLFMNSLQSLADDCEEWLNV